LILGLAAAPQAARFEAGPSLNFRHRAGTPEKDYIVETMGSGVALFDYDGDDDLDVYLVNASSPERVASGEPGEPNRLFRNGGGWKFTDVTEEAGVGDRGFGQGVAVADIDNDGDPDIYLTNYGPNVLYRNNGDGTFAELRVGVEDKRWSTTAAFGDIDADGFVDLYVCNYLDFDRELLDRLILRKFCEWKGLQVHCGPRGFALVSGALYHNRGDGSFEDWTEQAGLMNRETFQLGAVFSDLDLDGDQDLYVTTDTTINLLFENLGDGRFQNQSLLSGTGLSQNGMEQAGMGIDVGDVNGDGRLDLFVTNFSDDYNTLYLNQRGLQFIDSTDVAGLGVASLPYLGWSTRLADLDSDGDLDITLVNGHVYPQVDGSDVGASFRQPMQVFLNRGDGTFEDATKELGAVLVEPRASRGAALGDLNGDRSQDIVVNVMDGSPVLIQNNIPVADRTVTLKLVGRRANRDGIGALLRGEIGSSNAIREVRGDRGYLSHSDPRLYIGLGEHERIDKITIRWPGGGIETLDGLGAGSYTIVQGVGIVATH
jgi:hypothetical protein